MTLNLNIDTAKDLEIFKYCCDNLFVEYPIYLDKDCRTNDDRLNGYINEHNLKCILNIHNYFLRKVDYNKLCQSMK